MLEINEMLLGLTIVLFLAAMVLLNVWLYKPMLSFMQARDEKLKSDMQKAGSTDSDVAKLNSEAQEIIEEAKAQAAALRKKVIEDAKLLAQSKIDAKRAEIDSDYADFKSALETTKSELKTALVAQAPAYQDALKSKFSKL